MVAQSCPTLRDRMDCPWDPPGRNTGVGCRFLLRGIFPTQGSSLGLLRWQAGSVPLSHRRPAGERGYNAGSYVAPPLLSVCLLSSWVWNGSLTGWLRVWGFGGRLPGLISSFVTY